ncbi:hypothetical protein [Pseudomonas sp. TH31]|uniref:hypothetical protein n=1 Tax=Pseudomonas sp. TH31 TaxID=2796396 RepID=UPI00191200F1|nr:hypothetical protein [Pseudomonas sp. TH31]MBK5416201.1 hypothetical protein [Pseudomonas sp. TH31]
MAKVVGCRVDEISKKGFTVFHLRQHGVFFPGNLRLGKVMGLVQLVLDPFPPLVLCEIRLIEFFQKERLARPAIKLSTFLVESIPIYLVVFCP